MSEAKTIHERVAVAAGSNHLQHKVGACDVDVMGALGMAGIENRLSSAVFRLKYANEARFYPDALRDVQSLGRKLARSEGWTGSGQQIDELSKTALDFWLNDRCPECKGRGYEMTPGAPVLSDVACGACRGRGKMWPPRQRSQKWQQRLQAMLAMLDQREAQAGSDVMRRLSREMDGFKGVR